MQHTTRLYKNTVWKLSFDTLQLRIQLHLRSIDWSSVDRNRQVVNIHQVHFRRAKLHPPAMGAICAIWCGRYFPLLFFIFHDTQLSIKPISVYISTFFAINYINYVTLFFFFFFSILVCLSYHLQVDPKRPIRSRTFAVVIVVSCLGKLGRSKFTKVLKRVKITKKQSKSSSILLLFIVFNCTQLLIGTLQSVVNNEMHTY